MSLAIAPRACSLAGGRRLLHARGEVFDVTPAWASPRRDAAIWALLEGAALPEGFFLSYRGDGVRLLHEEVGFPG